MVIPIDFVTSVNLHDPRLIAVTRRGNFHTGEADYGSGS